VVQPVQVVQKHKAKAFFTTSTKKWLKQNAPANKT